MGNLSEKATYKHTAGGANVTVTTGPCTFAGLTMNGSAGASNLVLLDGTATVALTPSTTGGYVINPALPVAIRTSLSATMTGTGNYTIFYGQ